MKYSDEARKNLTETSEGFRSTAYKPTPTDPWTIGYGHTQGVRENDICTQEEADAFLQTDITYAEDDVTWWVKVPLTQFQFDALVDFVFNIGAGNFKSSTLLQKLNNKDYIGADMEFKKWVYAGGHILPGLVKRRELEADWFNGGNDE